MTLAILGAATASGGAAPSPQSYVALGDSYTAGPLIPTPRNDPLGCLRSDHNYPSIVASDLGVASFQDASCIGATTADMTAPENVTPGPNPPQFSRLSPTTEFVTVQIGGNDIGFEQILLTCTTPTPSGTPCQDHFVVGGDDTISDRIVATAPKVAAVIQGIHALSPNATVAVVGYLAILPDTGNGCWPQVPFAPGDVPYLRAREKQLNGMLAAQAAANNARFVDAYALSVGHDACEDPCARWVEPAIPANPAAPFHPNFNGMQGTAAAVLGTAAPVSAPCPVVLTVGPRFTG